MNTTAHLRVVVPPDQKMATEPAKAIAEVYAHKDTVKIALASIFGLLVAFGVNVAPDVPVLVENLANNGVPIAMGLYARWQLSHNANAQAAETREAVYAPATVASIVKQVERKAA